MRGMGTPPPRQRPAWNGWAWDPPGRGGLGPWPLVWPWPQFVCIYRTPSFGQRSRRDEEIAAAFCLKGVPCCPDIVQERWVLEQIFVVLAPNDGRVVPQLPMDHRRYDESTVGFSEGCLIVESD